MSDEKTIRDIATLKANYVNMAGDVAETKDAVNQLPEKLQILFDERYSRVSEVRELQETVEPFTQFRKRVWYLLIGGVLAVSVIALSASDKIKDLFH